MSNSNFNRGSSGITCCLNCEDRKIGCHGKCEKYSEQKRNLEVVRKKERQEKIAQEELFTSYWKEHGRRRF